MKLADICCAIVDCEHKTAPTQGDGVPLIRTTNIKGGRLDLCGADKVAESTYREWTARLEPQPGDLILAREAPVGEVGIVPANAKVCLGQRTVLVRPDNSKVDSRYLLYLLLTDSMRHRLVSRAEGSTTPHLNMSEIRALSLPTLAPLPEQRAIAHVLGTLDDKIELNRRMNDTLESMARALFKSWFVDFDPVRAKAEGRRPAGMDTETAALFPAAFHNSEIGHVPKSWSIKPIGNVVRVVGGSTPRTERAEYWDGGTISWATPKDLAGLSSPVLLETSKTITEIGLEQIGSGLLPAGTVLLSSRAPIGYLAVSDIPVAINQGFIAMVCDGVLPNHYVRLWTHNNMEQIIGRANGTTFLEISKANFRPLPVLVPSQPVLSRFVSVLEPLHCSMALNLKQVRTLANLRDTLLPKILSGELRIRDAEKFIEAHV